MNSKTKYKCGTCGEDGFDEESEAEEHCPNYAEEYFECGECGETFDDECEAEECCKK